MGHKLSTQRSENTQASSAQNNSGNNNNANNSTTHVSRLSNTSSNLNYPPNSSATSSQASPNQPSESYTAAILRAGYISPSELTKLAKEIPKKIEIYDDYYTTLADRPAIEKHIALVLFACEQKAKNHKNLRQYKSIFDEQTQNVADIKELLEKRGRPLKDSVMKEREQLMPKPKAKSKTQFNQTLTSL